jgi:hypothetical protein
MTRRLVHRSTSALDILAELRRRDLERDVSTMTRQRSLGGPPRPSIAALVGGYVARASRGAERRLPDPHPGVAHATCEAGGLNG